MIAVAELTAPLPPNTVNLLASTPSNTLTWSRNFFETSSVLDNEAPSGRVIEASNIP